MAEDGISPKQFKVEMAKNCQVLMLNETRDKKSKKIRTNVSSGDYVQNMGCIRDITQKELDATEKKKRYYLAWQNPVWCKVSVGNKEGWVLQQYLINESLEE